MPTPSVAIAVLLSGCAVALAQAYEVASVKPNTSNAPGSSSRGSKGQIVFTNQTFKRLIERAYDVKPYQVTGPSWIETLRFDIAAKYPPDTKQGDSALMLRALLEDRFQLAVHRQRKDMPGYALVVDKSGFKLKPVEPGGSETDGTAVSLTAKKSSMADLAAFVARRTGETVVDQTGVTGVYDFELHWTVDDKAPNDTAADRTSILFTALEETLHETLGLRLQSKKVPVDIIVVDRAERAPTGN